MPYKSYANRWSALDNPNYDAPPPSSPKKNAFSSIRSLRSKFQGSLRGKNNASAKPRPASSGDAGVLDTAEPLHITASSLQPEKVDSKPGSITSPFSPPQLQPISELGSFASQIPDNNSLWNANVLAPQRGGSLPQSSVSNVSKTSNSLRRSSQNLATQSQSTKPSASEIPHGRVSQVVTSLEPQSRSVSNSSRNSPLLLSSEPSIRSRNSSNFRHASAPATESADFTNRHGRSSGVDDSFLQIEREDSAPLSDSANNSFRMHMDRLQGSSESNQVHVSHETSELGTHSHNSQDSHFHLNGPYQEYYDSVEEPLQDGTTSEKEYVLDVLQENVLGSTRNSREAVDSDVEQLTLPDFENSERREKPINSETLDPTKNKSNVDRPQPIITNPTSKRGSYISNSAHESDRTVESFDETSLASPLDVLIKELSVASQSQENLSPVTQPESYKVYYDGTRSSMQSLTKSPQAEPPMNAAPRSSSLLSQSSTDNLPVQKNDVGDRQGGEKLSKTLTESDFGSKDCLQASKKRSSQNDEQPYDGSRSPPNDLPNSPVNKRMSETEQADKLLTPQRAKEWSLTELEEAYSRMQRLMESARKGMSPQSLVVSEDESTVKLLSALEASHNLQEAQLVSHNEERNTSPSPVHLKTRPFPLVNAAKDENDVDQQPSSPQDLILQESAPANELDRPPNPRSYSPWSARDRNDSPDSPRCGQNYQRDADSSKKHSAARAVVSPNQQATPKARMMSSNFFTSGSGLSSTADSEEYFATPKTSYSPTTFPNRSSSRRRLHSQAGRELQSFVSADEYSNVASETPISPQSTLQSRGSRPANRYASQENLDTMPYRLSRSNTEDELSISRQWFQDTPTGGSRASSPWRDMDHSHVSVTPRISLDDLDTLSEIDPNSLSFNGIKKYDKIELFLRLIQTAHELRGFKQQAAAEKEFLLKALRESQSLLDLLREQLYNNEFFKARRTVASSPTAIPAAGSQNPSSIRLASRRTGLSRRSNSDFSLRSPPFGKAKSSHSELLESSTTSKPSSDVRDGMSSRSSYATARPRSSLSSRPESPALGTRVTTINRPASAQAYTPARAPISSRTLFGEPPVNNPHIQPSRRERTSSFDSSPFRSSIMRKAATDNETPIMQTRIPARHRDSRSTVSMSSDKSRNDLLNAITSKKKKPTQSSIQQYSTSLNGESSKYSTALDSALAETNIPTPRESDELRRSRTASGGSTASASSSAYNEHLPPPTDAWGASQTDWGTDDLEERDRKFLEDLESGGAPPPNPYDPERTQSNLF